MRRAIKFIADWLNDAAWWSRAPFWFRHHVLLNLSWWLYESLRVS